MEECQEVVSYMVSEINRNRSIYSDPCELADRAADMFDLWEDDDLPDWLINEAEDIFFGNY
jgi:hypothetical protein